jgi:hypothetical protein
MNIAEFIGKWKKVELKERSASQEHFIDLCRLLEHPTPAEADPIGDTFCFEKGAAKHGGGGRLRRCLEERFLRMGIQGETQRPQRRLRPVAPVP